MRKDDARKEMEYVWDVSEQELEDLARPYSYLQSVANQNLSSLENLGWSCTSCHCTAGDFDFWGRAARPAPVETWKMFF